MEETFNTLCNAIALVYHESRNVRHLVHLKLLNEDKWRFLVSLPVNRDAAWREIAPLRDKAMLKSSVDSALQIFESRFQISISEVAEMLENENWRHAKSYGGNAWANIVHLTINLANAIKGYEPESAENLAIQINNARHNTGSLSEKLARLEKAKFEYEKCA